MTSGPEENDFEVLLGYAKERFDDGLSNALLFKTWLKSSLEKWAGSARASSFDPFDADFATDEDFADKLTDFLAVLRQAPQLKEIGPSDWIASTLVEALQQLIDKNVGWEPQPGSPESTHMRDTALNIFKTVQQFEPEHAIRWAEPILKSENLDQGFLADPDTPFPIALYRALDDKSTSTELRCNFFRSLYDWAVLNTDDEGVQAIFRKFFIKRLEAVYGSDVDGQIFDILNAAFQRSGSRPLSLAPESTLLLSLGRDAELTGNSGIFDEFADELSDLAAHRVSRFMYS